MNEQNYASLAASKRLVDAGIVLETDFNYCQKSDNYPIALQYNADPHVYRVFIPAPTMAEVWNELPARTHFFKGDSLKTCNIINPYVANDNPTDALIDYLIWLKQPNRLVATGELTKPTLEEELSRECGYGGIQIIYPKPQGDIVVTVGGGGGGKPTEGWGCGKRKHTEMYGFGQTREVFK